MLQMITRLSPLDLRKLPAKEESVKTERTSTIVSVARKAILISGRPVTFERRITNEKAIELVSSRAMRLSTPRVLSPLRFESVVSAPMSPAFHIRQPTAREEVILRRAHQEMIQGRLIIRAPVDLHLWVRGEIGRQAYFVGVLNGPISVVGQFDRIRKKIFAIERYERLSVHELDILNAFRSFIKHKTIDPKNKLDVYLWMVRRAVFVGLTEGEFLRTFARLWLISDVFCEKRIRLRLQEEVEKGVYRIDDELKLRAFALRGLRHYDCHAKTVDYFIRLKKFIPAIRPVEPMRVRSDAFYVEDTTPAPKFVMKFESVKHPSTWVTGEAAVKQEEFLVKLNLKLASLQSR